MMINGLCFFPFSCLSYMIMACAGYECYDVTELSAINGLTLLSVGLIYLSGSTILLLFISFYLSYVLPTEYGVRKSPFFPLIGNY